MPCHRSLPPRARFWRPLTLLLALSFLLLAQVTAHAQTGANAAAGSTGTVSVVRLNVRSTPSMSGAILGRLNQNDTVTVAAVSDDGAWLQVQAPGIDEGWVFADYVDAGAPTAATPSTSAADAAAPASAESPAAEASTAEAGADTGAPAAMVVSDRINVRSGPGTN